MKNYFPILVVALAVLSSCRKEEDAVPQPAPVDHKTYLDASINPYKFKQGSYWVYENDSTGVLDSLYIDSVSTGFFVSSPGIHGGPNSLMEFYKMYVHDVSASVFYNQTLLGYSMHKNFTGTWSTGFHGQPVYISDAPLGTEYNGATIAAKFISMTVNAITFDNVDQIKITAAAQHDPEFDHDTYLYYCDLIGLLKKETLLSPGNIESWSIKRWHVIR